MHKAVYRNRIFSASLNNFGKILALLALLAPMLAAAAPALSRVSCGGGSYNAAATDACSVYLTANTNGKFSVTLTSSNLAVTVPGRVTVKSGAASTGFNAIVGPVTTAQTATITAQADGVTSTFNIVLSPAGVPALTVSATSVTFGNVSVGTTATQSVALTSSGTAPVTISSISVAGSLFGATGITAPVTLNPGQTTTMNVTFSPFQPSPGYNYTGLLTIATTAPAATISLSGAGVVVAPAVSAVSCSSTSVTGSLADACTVSLSGAAPTGGVSVSLASSSSAVTVPGSVMVPASATSAPFTANVASVTSAQTTTLTATSGSTSKAISLQLNAATPALTVSATSLSFGIVSLGTAVTKSVTVTSSGTAPVTINSASITGTGFSVSGANFPATLNPGQATVVTVQFNPTTTSSVTGQLTISSNASPTVVSLSGAGTTVAPTVSAVSCSSTSIMGSLADTCTLSLSGSAPSGGVSVSLASSNSAVMVPSSVMVPATATSAVFTANVASVTTAQTATLTATSGGTSKTVSLQLNAAAPGLTLSTTTIGFGSVIMNTPVSQSVTLRSTGTAAVTVNSASVSGTGFSVSGATLPATLNPGQSMTLEVQFDPATVGPLAGQLTITSSASARSVALSGTGASHEMDLTWSCAAGSSYPVVGYNIYRAPSGMTSYQRVNATLETLRAYTDTTVQSGMGYDYIVKSVDSQGQESTPSNMTTVRVP